MVEAQAEYFERTATRMNWVLVVLALIPIGLIVGVTYRITSEWIGG